MVGFYFHDYRRVSKTMASFDIQSDGEMWGAIFYQKSFQNMINVPGE